MIFPSRTVVPVASIALYWYMVVRIVVENQNSEFYGGSLPKNIWILYYNIKT